MRRMPTFRSKKSLPLEAIAQSQQEKLAAQVQAALSALDRASSALQRRKRAATLAALLNSVEGDASVVVLEVLRRHDAARRLLTLLDGAMDDSDDDSDGSQDMNDVDLMLAASLLSCLASLSFLGGVRELQAAGGVLQLLKLMRYNWDAPFAPLWRWQR